MANQYNSKIVLSTGEVLIDLTLDDIKPEHVDKGIQFHDKTGATKAGTSTKTVDASEVTAEAAEVLAGRTFAKGTQVQTGTMPDNSGNNIEIQTTTPVSIPRGYTDGSTKVQLASGELAKLIPSNIKEGVSILGVEGDYGTDDISSQHKSATPTFEQQEITPDAGYTFLTSVTIAPITVSRADNDAGGVTVTIGG